MGITGAEKIVANAVAAKVEGAVASKVEGAAASKVEGIVGSKPGGTTPINGVVNSPPLPLTAGTRPGANSYWSDGLGRLHPDQTNHVLGQIDNTCGAATLQVEALRRGKNALGFEKEIAKVLEREDGKILGMRFDQVHQFAKKMGLNPSQPEIRKTVDYLRNAIKAGDTAIVMIGKTVGDKSTFHFIVVEKFTEISLFSAKIPMVQIVDTSEGVRKLVTQAEFTERFAETVGQMMLIPK